MAAMPDSRTRDPSPQPAPSRRPVRGPAPRRLLVKVLVVVGVVATAGFLFVRSIKSQRAAPYKVPPEQLRGLTLAFAPGAGPTSPALVLQAPPALVSGLFRQVFARAMESLNAPAATGVPLLLQSEIDGAFAGRVTPEALMSAAREAGLDGATLTPRCLGYRRESEPGSVRQLFFVLFDMPGFTSFRQKAAALAGGGAGPSPAFDPAALSPVLLVASSEPSFSRWLPLRADPDKDCVAPIAAKD
jgi:hypothetical protein